MKTDGGNAEFAQAPRAADGTSHIISCPRILNGDLLTGKKQAVLNGRRRESLRQFVVYNGSIPTRLEFSPTSPLAEEDLVLSHVVGGWIVSRPGQIVGPIGVGCKTAHSLRVIAGKEVEIQRRRLIDEAEPKVQVEIGEVRAAGVALDDQALRSPDNLASVGARAELDQVAVVCSVIDSRLMLAPTRAILI